MSLQLQEPFGLRVVFNGNVAVDSFFVLSACLLTYLTFNEMDKTGGRFNIPLFYLHRYIRLQENMVQFLIYG